MSPARASECRKCDSLLVPYCDHELDAKLREWVDEHVVNCKRCGIQLSCIELESLRLREALVPMEPSLEFVNSVMDRVRDVVATETPVDPPSSVTGKDFTSRVLNQVRRDLGEPVEPSRDASAWGPSRIAVAVLAAALLVAAVTLPFLVSDPVEPKSSAGTWFVIRAENAGSLRVGDALRLPLREELRGGVLEIENGSDGAGWKIGLEGDGRFTVLSKNRVRLEDGEISAWTEAASAAALAIDLPGGHALTLSSGRFEINVEGVAYTNLIPGLDRITVRVHEGSAKFRTHGSELLVPLPSGSLALLEPLRPLQIQALPSPDSLARLLETEVRGGPARSEEDSNDVVVRGYVRAGQANGVVPGAVVSLHAGERVTKATSKTDGSYELRLPLEDATSDEFWISAVAPAGRMDLGDLSYRTLRDVLSAGETHFEDLRLASVQARSGRLLGADGAAVVGARIRALRIDGFFGSARLLPGVETRSAEDGGFVLPGLAPEGAGETTALLIEPASGRAAPHVEYGVTGGGDSSPLLIRVPTGSLAELPVQDLATRIVWIEKRPAGIAGAYWRSIERVELPAAGRRTVQTLLTRGSTLCWWEDAGTGRPSRGHEGDPLWASPSEVAILGSTPPRSIGRDGLVGELPAANASTPSEAMAFVPLPGLSSLGFGRDAPRPAASRARAGAQFSELELRVFEGEAGVSIEAARVYLRVADGPAWFAGFTDLDGRIVVRDLPRGVAVRAIAFAGRGIRLLGAKRVVVDEARERHRVAMTSVRVVETAVPLSAANSHANVRIFDGPFQGYEVCTRVGADGSLRLGDLPPGALRIQIADRQTVVAADVDSGLRLAGLAATQVRGRTLTGRGALSPASIASDTIFALASAAAKGERAIFRLSGPQAFPTIDALAGRSLPRTRCVVDLELLLPGAWSSSVVLPARLLLFPGPSSYTGEDVVEIHVLSSPPLFELVHENLRRHGLRQASPGEFTRRAFEHGKIDLTQAEAVLALIRAEDDEALRRASRSLRESVDIERESVREALVDVLALLESGLDFSDGETGSVEDAAWVPRLRSILSRLDAMSATEAVPERSGLPSYVLLGPPNAGKTSLWNTLRRLRPVSADARGDLEEGLVSTLAGTTRDLRWADFAACRLGDAPGRAEWAARSPSAPAGAPSDEELAILASEVARADGWIWVIPADAITEPPAQLGRPALRIASQFDRVAAAEIPPGWLACSARTGDGAEAVLEALVRLGARAPFAARSTDLRERLRDASIAASRALEMRESGHEIVVAELTRAVAALAPSDATEVPEELLDRIFARFCLGK